MPKSKKQVQAPRPQRRAQEAAPTTKSSFPQNSMGRTSTSASRAARVSHGDYVNMLVDPIMAPAAQMPDEWSGPTQPMKLKATFNLKADANGLCAVKFFGRLAAFSNTGITITSDVMSGGTSVAHPDNTSFGTAFDDYRTLAMGIKYISLLPEDAAQGIVGFATGKATAMAYTSHAAIMNDVDAFAAKDEVHMFVYPFDRPTFVSSSLSTEYFPMVWVTASGITASATFARLEVYINVEGIPMGESIHSGSADVEPYDSYSLNVGTVVGQQQPHVDQNHRRLTSEGRAVADMSARMLGAYLGNPALGSATEDYRELRKKIKELLRKHSL